MDQGVSYGLWSLLRAAAPRLLRMRQKMYEPVSQDERGGLHGCDFRSATSLCLTADEVDDAAVVVARMARSGEETEELSGFRSQWRRRA